MIGRTEMARGFESDLTNMLPVDAMLKGFSLILRDPRTRPDPVYLRDRDGIIRQQWDYVPSMGEVDGACRLIK